MTWLRGGGAAWGRTPGPRVGVFAACETGLGIGKRCCEGATVSRVEGRETRDEAGEEGWGWGRTELLSLLSAFTVSRRARTCFG